MWAQALRGWNVAQSQQVLEWMAEGKLKGQLSALLRVLRARFGALPADLEAAIRAATDLNVLDGWTDAAATSPTLQAFRQSVRL